MYPPYSIMKRYFDLWRVIKPLSNYFIQTKFNVTQTHYENNVKKNEIHDMKRLLMICKVVQNSGDTALFIILQQVLMFIILFIIL